MTTRHFRAGVAFGVVGALALVGDAAIFAVPAFADGRLAVAQVGTAAMVPSGASPLGAMAADAVVHGSVVLRPSDMTGLADYAQSASTPGSSDYRQFLTPSQVEERFGPPTGVRADLQNWLTSRGLQPGQPIGDGLVQPFTGSAGAVEAAFQTPLEQFSLADGRVVHANVDPPSLPASLAPSVLTVVGLDNVVRSSPDDTAAGGGPSAAPAALPAGSPQGGGPVPCSQAVNNPNHAYTADQIAGLYSLTSLYSAGDRGQGITVALFENTAYAQSDVATYLSCYGINPTITQIPVDGGPGTTQNVPAEAVLDIEDVAGLAPDAQILVYNGNPNNPSADAALDVFATIAQQDRAQVVSSSWSLGCEAAFGPLMAQALGVIFQTMAAQGQSVLASAGDQGSEGCLRDVGSTVLPAPAVYSLAVGALPSEPFVTAVGGTQLQRGSTVQQVWNTTGTNFDGSGDVAPFASYPGDQAASGGISSFWTAPSWQVGFDASGNASGAPCGAAEGTVCREIPDVSALAGPPDYAVYNPSARCSSSATGWCGNGGTSAAAPTWAAFIALVDEQTPGHELGLLNPALYRIERTTPGAFTDITQPADQPGGNNFLAQSGTPNNYTCAYNGVAGQSCYLATPGYDMATGLGTPVGDVLAAALSAGYTLGGADGGVFTFGASQYYGSMGGQPLDKPIVGLVATPDGQGYWEVGSDGGIFAFGDAGFFGSMGGRTLSAPIVGLVATPDGQGYWEAASDGGIFAFGDAGYHGSMGGKALNSPIVALAATPDGQGYWEAASDGGIFAFGDAGFFGSMGGQPLNKPIAGLAAVPEGQGYWEVASDGGIFAFGSAPFLGSTGGLALNAPVIGMTRGG